MNNISEIPSDRRVIGYRQVAKGILGNRIRCVLIAQDTDGNLMTDIVRLCRDHKISYSFFSSKEELGDSLGIDVACAVVGELMPDTEDFGRKG